MIDYTRLSILYNSHSSPSNYLNWMTEVQVDVFVVAVVVAVVASVAKDQRLIHVNNAQWK